jgi:hypothetical protein
MTMPKPRDHVQPQFSSRKCVHSCLIEATNKEEFRKIAAHEDVLRRATGCPAARSFTSQGQGTLFLIRVTDTMAIGTLHDSSSVNTSISLATVIFIDSVPTAVLLSLHSHHACAGRDTRSGIVSGMNL